VWPARSIAERRRRQRDDRNLEPRLADLTLSVQADCFPERIAGFLRRPVLESPIDELRRALHAFESRALEATAEGGQLEDGVAREHEEGDDAEQDFGEFFHAPSLASPWLSSDVQRFGACAGVVHNRDSTSAASRSRKPL
jgi:hypothetical protein